jgi:hypothetical protein
MILVCVGLVHPQSCTPYVQIGLMMHLYSRHLFSVLNQIDKNLIYYYYYYINCLVLFVNVCYCCFLLTHVKFARK